MTDSQRAHTTRLLRHAVTGDASAADELMPSVYDELRQLASHLMRREQPGITLQPTALVHEAFLRLIDQSEQGWENRRHFQRLASMAMRRILVDAARSRSAQRRGGDRGKVSWNDELAISEEPSHDILEVDAVLERLEKHDAELARIVEMKFFGGMDFQEIAKALDMSLRSMERRWRFAKSWMAREIAVLRDTGSDA